MFKVKCNRELKPPDAQNAVEIVTFTLVVIHYKCDLRADCFFAQVHLRNPQFPASKRSTQVGSLHCPGPSKGFELRMGPGAHPLT